MNYYRPFPKPTTRELRILLIGIVMALTLAILSGCSLFGGTTANMSGMLKVEDGDPNGCMIFQGNGRYDGRVSESHIDGSIYVRKGTCNTQDQAKAK